MLMLHDIWLNWFGEEEGYNVCHFHEWRKDDDVELLDQIPIVFVESPLFDYIENSMSEIPQQLLGEVKGKAFLRINYERIKLEHCFVLTDGKGILAVDTMGYNMPVRKSRLIPRQEQLVFAMVELSTPTKYEFTTEEKVHTLYSPEPASMVGLTRRERNLKQILYQGLSSDEDVHKLRYWYSEWNSKEYQNIKDFTYDELINRLSQELFNGWTDQHEALCSVVVKGQLFLEKLYEIENVRV